MPNEAIYFITPTLKNVQAIVKDFKKENKPKYNSAQIYFSENCPDDIFKVLEKVPGKFIKELKEVNLSFVPLESQVSMVTIVKFKRLHILIVKLLKIKK